jgi:hypothetical protein
MNHSIDWEEVIMQAVLVWSWPTLLVAVPLIELLTA